MAANRLLRWALILRSFDYSIEYIKGTENSAADVLSRLPIEEGDPSSLEKRGSAKASHLLHLRLEDIPVTRRRLKK
ncbi:unnamed protein product, partial [Nesidiocoris tenuis]